MLGSVQYLQDPITEANSRVESIILNTEIRGGFLAPHSALEVLSIEVLSY